MKNFSILCFLLTFLVSSISAQGNDPDEEPSLQTEDRGMKKSQSEITKLKADVKKKSKIEKELSPKIDLKAKEINGKPKSEKKNKSEKKPKKKK